MYLLSIVFKRTSLIVLFFLGCASNAGAAINGVTGTQTTGAVTFDLIGSFANIPTPDGNSVHMWGYGVAGSVMQYPGPTLIVNQGDVVTVNLTNTHIPMPVSILFPGQEDVVATGGTAGQFTRESTMSTPGTGDTVSYTFTASNPGTYTYYSGTQPGLQIEMGLMGALIVRSTTPDQAYNDTDAASQYDVEYLYVLSSIDPKVHQDVEFGLWADVDNTVSHATLWFINGRLAPDTLFPENTHGGDQNAPFLPNQPYTSLAVMYPGQRVLARVIGGGREAHPFHFHGNNYTHFARDGRLLSSTGTAADLAYSDYTLQALPGSTYDVIWQWSGDKLGFDIYGTNAGGQIHDCTDGPDADDYDDITHEYCPDHDKAIPETFPEGQELTYGGFYSGSPFLGDAADLPPGEGGLNVGGGMFFMWHSHNEKELTNDDIFPGGMLTQMIVLPHPDFPQPPIVLP